MLFDLGIFSAWRDPRASVPVAEQGTMQIRLISIQLLVLQKSGSNTSNINYQKSSQQYVKEGNKQGSSD